MKLIILLVIIVIGILFVNREEFQPEVVNMNEDEAVQALLELGGRQQFSTPRVAINRAKLQFNSPNAEIFTTMIFDTIPLSTIQTDTCRLGVVSAPHLLEPFFGNQVSRALSRFTSSERFTITGYKDQGSSRARSLNVLTSTGVERVIGMVKNNPRYNNNPLLIYRLRVTKEILSDIDTEGPECILPYLERY
jgi:hypothetical protein